MKQIRKIGMSFVLLMLAACSGAHLKAPEADAVLPVQQVSNPVTQNNSSNPAVIQTIEFRPGVSSATVERMAKNFGCNGSKGAGLITPAGPVEVYRMKCDNGSNFLAQCELRQCRPMR